MKHPLRRFASSPRPAGGGRSLWSVLIVSKGGSTAALAQPPSLQGRF